MCVFESALKAMLANEFFLKNTKYKMTANISPPPSSQAINHDPKNVSILNMLRIPAELIMKKILFVLYWAA